MTQQSAMRRFAHWLFAELSGPKRPEDVFWWCTLLASVVSNTIALSVDEPARTTFAVSGALLILIGMGGWLATKWARGRSRER